MVDFFQQVKGVLSAAREEVCIASPKMKLQTTLAFVAVIIFIFVEENGAATPLLIPLISSPVMILGPDLVMNLLSVFPTVNPLDLINQGSNGIVRQSINPSPIPSALPMMPSAPPGVIVSTTMPYTIPSTVTYPTSMAYTTVSPAYSAPTTMVYAPFAATTTAPTMAYLAPAPPSYTTTAPPHSILAPMNYSVPYVPMNFSTYSALTMAYVTTTPTTYPPSTNPTPGMSYPVVTTPRPMASMSSTTPRPYPINYSPTY